jgi:Ni/Co efflux regulator RcnB
MKIASIGVAVAALALSLSSVAFAQGHSNDRGKDRGNDRGQGHGQNRGNDNARGNPHRAQPPAPARYDRGRGMGDRSARDGRGAGPEHNFYRGGRLPPVYRSRQYVVDDWRGHRLSAPPRGYHWVQAGGDYVLVAITTGVILSILLNN